MTSPTGEEAGSLDMFTQAYRYDIDIIRFK